MSPAAPGAGPPAAGPGQIVIEPGSYAASVDVPFPASLLVSPTTLVEKLGEKGFSDVRATDRRPQDWPLPGTADYYVSASWKHDPKLFDLPKQVRQHVKVS